MQTGYPVMDAMTTQPITTTAQTSISACAQLMAKHDVSCIIVIEKKTNKLLGIISEQDIVHKVVAKNANTAKLTVNDCMTKKVITIAPDVDLYDAIVSMRDHNIRHLPVVVKQHLQGIITLKDILKIEPDLFDIAIEKWNIKESARKPIFGNVPKGYFELHQ